jgi:hypothetical protein
MLKGLVLRRAITSWLLTGSTTATTNFVSDRRLWQRWNTWIERKMLGVTARPLSGHRKEGLPRDKLSVGV